MEASLAKRRILQALFALAAAVPLLVLGTGEAAMAAPAGCSVWFTPTNANPDYTGGAGYCSRGTGTYYVQIRCNLPHFPDYDKRSGSVAVGHQASVTCNYGNHVKSVKMYTV
jgi:hypothetical protein